MTKFTPVSKCFFSFFLLLVRTIIERNNWTQATITKKLNKVGVTLFHINHTSRNLLANKYSGLHLRVIKYFLTADLSVLFHKKHACWQIVRHMVGACKIQIGRCVMPVSRGRRALPRSSRRFNLTEIRRMQFRRDSRWNHGGQQFLSGELRRRVAPYRVGAKTRAKERERERERAGKRTREMPWK